MAVLLLLGTTVAACSDDAEKEEGGAEVPQFTIPASVLNNGMTFSKTGGSTPLNIRSTLPPTVTSNSSWCKVTEETSVADNMYKYMITAELNDEPADREATVSIEIGGTEQGRFVVKQTEGDGLIVADDCLRITLADGNLANFEVKLTTNGTPTVTINDSWITGTFTRGMEEMSYSFAAGFNFEGAERTGTITFTLGVCSETVTVIQPKGEEVVMGSDALTLAAKMYTGINIGNTMEVPKEHGGEGAWSGGGKVNRTYVAGLKALGFNAVRIPCAWDSYIINRETNELDPAWLERVSEVVGYCLENDMYAMLNIHWDGGWLEETVAKGYDPAVDAKQKALWTQIATKLNKYDERLLFAGCNEPGQQDQGNVGEESINAMLKYEQTFIDAVRGTGGNNAGRCLVVQGPYTNIDRTVTDYKMPTDYVKDRLFVEIHFYDPWNFTGMEKDEDWGNMFWYWGQGNHVEGSTHNPTWGEEDHVKDQFRKMKEAYVDKGIPVIVGEYSASRRTNTDNEEMHLKSRAYWNEVVTREAKNAGCIPFYWETSGDINRNDGTAKDELAIEGILKGAAAGVYPF